MGGKSRKTGGVSKKLIDKLNAQMGKKCVNKPKENKNQNTLGLDNEKLSKSTSDTEPNT